MALNDVLDQLYSCTDIYRILHPKTVVYTFFSSALDHLYSCTDIYRILHPQTVVYTFFSSAHGMFSRKNDMLVHKTSLNKFKRIEIISSTFSDHNSMKLEIKYRKKNGKNTNTWRLDNILVKNQRVNEDIKKEIRKYLETIENKNTIVQNL